MPRIFSKQLFIVLIILFLFIGFNSCMGGGIPVWFPPSESGGTSGPDTSTQGSSSTAGNPSIDGEDTASLPLPSNDSFMISNADADGAVVALGSIDDYESDYGVAVVNSTEYARYQKEQNTLLAQVKNKINSLVSLTSAHAESSSGCFDGKSYITELTVDAEGTVTAQAISNYTHGDELKLVYFDLTTCELGDETDTGVLKNLLYVAQAAASTKAITSDDTNLYQTDGVGNVVKVAQNPADTDSPFVVQNSFDANYIMASVGGSVSAVMYNPTQDDFNFMNEHVVSANVYKDGLFLNMTDSSEICVNADGCSPVAMKQKDGKSYFITENNGDAGALSHEWIHELYNENLERIQFITGSELDDDGHPITFRAAKAFDVVVDGDDYKDVLVIFEDGRGNTRLLGLFGNYRGTPYPIVTERLSGILDIQDLIIYSAQSSDDTSNGSAFLTTDSGIHFIDYDFIETVCEEDEEGECTDDRTQLSVDTSHPITISNLVSVVVNDEGTYAYALADSKISVIDLSSKSVTRTIALSDVVSKSITFNASALLYTTIGEKDYLVVSVDSLKGAIVIDLNQTYEH